MTVRKILEIGHPVLNERAQEVDVSEITSPEVQGWIDDMVDSMRAANGAGIAANQIGIPQRIFVAEVKGDNPRYPYKPPIPFTVVVNPVVEFLSDRTFENYEGCLSVPGIRGVVTRHLEMRMTGYDREGNALDFEMRGYSAGTFQHEFDHLDGFLFPHRVTDPRSFCSWDSFREFHERDFAARVQSLVDEWGM